MDAATGNSGRKNKFTQNSPENFYPPFPERTTISEDKIGITNFGNTMPLQINDDGTATFWSFNESGPLSSTGILASYCRLKNPDSDAEHALLACMASIRETAKKIEQVK